MIQNTKLNNKIVLILGLGIHGGGKHAIIFSHFQKAKQILVSELAEQKRFNKILQSLLHITIDYEFAGHSKQFIDKADYIIKNPSIPPYSPILHYALAQNKNIETDISLFLHSLHLVNSNTDITMVTGTKGKSSISMALYRLQQQHLHHSTKRDNQVQLVGNIRNSVLSVSMAMSKEEIAPQHIVCELSAQQSGDLQYTSTLALQNIRCLVFTNFMRDHLNYYKDMENYFQNKIFIFKKFAQYIQQQNKQSLHTTNKQVQHSIIIPNDVWGKRIAELYNPEHCVWHSSNAVLEDHKRGAWIEQKSNKYIFYYRTKENASAKICCIVEKNNIQTHATKQSEQQHSSIHYFFQNIVTIIAYCIAHTIPVPNSINSFKDLLAIEHRKELLGSINGIHFINDSAATIPHAMQIESLTTKPVFLICGGTDKNLIAKDIIPECKVATQCYFLAGTFTDIILPLLASEHVSHAGVFTCLEDAVDKAIFDAKKINKLHNTESIIILSPGCASFGMFKHEFDRGDTFKRIVQAYKESVFIQ